MARGQSLFNDGSGTGIGRKSRGDNDMDLDITPMIDVTFLLLIFFMVTSTMQSTPDLQVPEAKHGIGLDTNAATIISIRAGDPPVIVLGDGKGPEGTIDELKALVEENIKDQKFQVVIKADRDVPHGFVQTVAKAIAELEGIQFFVGVQDKPAK